MRNGKIGVTTENIFPVIKTEEGNVAKHNALEDAKAQMRGLARNKRFYIREIHATGPDGVERTLNGVMEVIIK